MFRVLALVFLFVSLNAAALSIERVETVDDESGRTVSVTVAAAGLGSKEAPKLVEKIDVAYEDGVENNFMSDYENGQKLRKYDLMYKDGSIWGNGSHGLYVDRDRASQRYPESEAVLHGTSFRSFLSNPKVWSTDGTGVTSDKLYVSWWFKQENDTRYYFQFRLTELTPGFEPSEGDEFEVKTESGAVRGRVVAWKDGILHAIFWEQNNANLIRGEMLALDGSGESAKLEESVAWQGSNKFVRLWESDGAGGTFRLSWTSRQVTLSGILSEASRPEVAEKKWNHMEIFIDRSSKSIKTYVNSDKTLSAYYDEDLVDPGHSPTIGLIGFDASIELIQEIWLDDIYMDNSFKRVVLADAPEYSQISHQEVQRFVKWKDGVVSFELNLGGLNRSEPSYIYFYDENNKVYSETGIEWQSRPVMSAN